MSGIEWTGELIGIVTLAALVLAGLGYALAFSLQGRKLVQAQARLVEAGQQLAAAHDDMQALQTVLAGVREQHHQQQLLLGRQEEQLSASRDSLQRVTAEFAQRQQQLADLQARLDSATADRHAVERQLEKAEAGGRALGERLTEAHEALQQERNSLQQLQERYQNLQTQHAELETTLAEREKHFQQQMQQLQETRQSLTREFENLANKIFEEKGKTFTQTSQSSIDTLLKPFREQIEGFQKRINDVHDASLQGNSNLVAEIRKVLDIGLQMSKEANNLTSALKGDSQQRGAWGEAQLRRTLEMSGLIEEDHFEVQSSFRDAEGRQKQTDYLIKLPDGKHIIIDSKVSLVAYDRAVSAETAEQRTLAMHEHVKAVRRHIDDLASKDYTNLIGMRSPGFVLMFMPIEPAYIEALKNNRDLFEYGYKKGIVLVSHTTLIPILRTVSNLWMIERSNAEAREISERAGDIYNQVCTVAERLSKLGGTLATVSNHYNSAVTALAGKQGLYGKVERFAQLSAKVSKSLPQIEPAHMDFETERLSMIVEAIGDDEPKVEPVAALEAGGDEAGQD